MRTLLNLVSCVLIALAGLFVTMIAAGEAVIAWYMHHYAVPSRLELSEDMGFGMLMLAVWGASFFTLPIWGFLGWYLVHRLKVRKPPS